MALALFVNIRGTLYETDPESNWPTTTTRCPVDGAKLFYTVHGDCFFCDSESLTGPEGAEHVFGTTLRWVSDY